MERLTNSNKEIPTLFDNAEYWLTMYFKLKDYENLEEQDRLVKLPCKVGDTVYVNGVLGCGEAERYKVIRVDYHSTLGTGKKEFYIEALLCTDPDSSIGFYDKQFDKTVFLTKAEAEAKLKELRGGVNER